MPLCMMIQHDKHSSFEYMQYIKKRTECVTQLYGWTHAHWNKTLLLHTTDYLHLLSCEYCQTSNRYSWGSLRNKGTTQVLVHAAQNHNMATKTRSLSTTALPLKSGKRCSRPIYCQQQVYYQVTIYGKSRPSSTRRVILRAEDHNKIHYWPTSLVQHPLGTSGSCIGTHMQSRLLSESPMETPATTAIPHLQFPFPP